MTSRPFVSCGFVARADICAVPTLVGYVNGLPLVFIELKGFEVDHNDAYKKNYRDYRGVDESGQDGAAWPALSNTCSTGTNWSSSPTVISPSTPPYRHARTTINGRGRTRTTRSQTSSPCSCHAAAGMLLAKDRLLDIVEASSCSIPVRAV